jgi:hypothetical protein
LIPKLAIAPPVDETVNPVAIVFTVLISEVEERVKAGAARVGAVVEDDVELLTIFSARVVTGSDGFDGSELPLMLNALIVKV